MDSYLSPSLIAACYGAGALASLLAHWSGRLALTAGHLAALAGAVAGIGVSLGVLLGDPGPTFTRATLTQPLPEPRIVIAVGACASSGGIVGEGYASAGGVDKVLPVDVYIPGCPPQPEAIIFDIPVAFGRLDARRAPRKG